MYTELIPGNDTKTDTDDIDNHMTLFLSSICHLQKNNDHLSCKDDGDGSSSEKKTKKKKMKNKNKKKKKKRKEEDEKK